MRLLALVDSPNHVCCRYRIRAFEPALARAGWSLTCEALRRGPIARLRQLAAVGRYDAVILQRKLLSPWEVAILRKHARQLAFDFDDAVLFRDSYDRRGPYSGRRERRFAAIVGCADAVLAGNDFLADCALRAGADPPRVRTIPTCVEPALYPEAGTAPGKHAPGHVDLVWIGSASTLQGLQQQKPLLDRLGREIPGLRLRVICDQFPRLDVLPVVPVPWSEAWEGRDLAEGHIGISWLPDDPWSRGKCGLKVLQYQAARLPVVANPVGVQCEMISPGETGFLASTDEEWLEAVRALAADPAPRRAMGRAARTQIEGSFSVAAWADAFVSAASGRDLGVRPGELRPAGGPRHAIPEPFFARLRRMGHLPGPAGSRHLDGTRGTR
ncbi:MAG: glycosyltransferase family 4 protein [Isosphaeraceae bacterium]